MIIADVFLGSPQWLWPVVGLISLATALILWGYWRCGSPVSVRTTAGLLKLAGITALLFCLLEPMFSGTQPRSGANLFVIVADNSQSMIVKDLNVKESRGELAQKQLKSDEEWQTRLEQDFDVRRYTFDDRVHSVADFHKLDFQGKSSHLTSTLNNIADRFKGRPLAGVLLFTDGNVTNELADFDWNSLPTIYPVVTGTDSVRDDLSVKEVAVSQTNFEAAPVTVRAEIDASGFVGENVTVLLKDQADKVVERKKIRIVDGPEPHVARFQFRPAEQGVNFYRVEVTSEEEKKENSTSPKPVDRSEVEATFQNNQRTVAVDRNGGPYRILYVSGRPNWEFKFLRRAIQTDPETELVGLIRLAKREPRFTFRDRAEDGTRSSFYQGFEDQNDEEAEQYFQPVLIRIGTEEGGEELRDGFPKTADQLFRYHAIILDDIEAEFFTPDQMTLIKQFVAQRGGGLMMLGGQESFAEGEFDRTTIGDLLPVYTDAKSPEADPQIFRFSLARDGWLEPWARLRKTEDEERIRINEMPDFVSINRVQRLKPGAERLGELRNGEGDTFPAIATQSFGKGRTAAVLIASMWRWDLQRESNETSDLQKAWRQTVRWLVGEVPKRIEVDVQTPDQNEQGQVLIRTIVRDEVFDALDNAQVKVSVKMPDGKSINVTAQASESEPGVYEAKFAPTQSGAYQASVTVNGPDGSEIGQEDSGWASEPAADEFKQLKPNTKLLEEIAERTEGEVISLEQLDSFVADLPNKRQVITETKIYPLWHRAFLFAIAIICLAGEWALRRYKGLP